MVYVQDREGNPLMPTERYGKVRRLLDCGRAEVVCRCPFTIRLANQAARFVKGYQLFDKVRYNGTECFITGRRTSGSMYLRDFDGNTVNAGAGWRRIALVSRSRTLLTERRTCDSSQR